MIKSISILVLFCCVGSIILAQDVSNERLIRIATYNIRREGKEKAPERLWQDRKQRVVNLISCVNPDIIGMQEATESQIADLGTLLPLFLSIGKGRGASWGGLGTNEYNPIFYNKEKFELLDQGTFAVNTCESALPFWNIWYYKQTGWLPRICTWAQFKDRATDKTFYIYNTHLDNDYDEAREFSAHVIRKHMDGKKPIIVTGDFNMPFTRFLPTIFDNFVHARDSAEEQVGPQETRTGWADDELKQIDHILIQKDTARMIRFEVIAEERPYSSDHRLAFADISFS
jgi:endonuclease/exonuclease/phosphatase family metal-dependent hydrolase